jgi:ATP-binding cassette subfamily B multidrug efflux pump
VELAIQEQLLGLMEGKTVIAIAHRLSTIARMDRLIVLEEGRIVEQGSHDELLRLGGHYERLWRHQSGGFLAHYAVATETAIELPDEPPPDKAAVEAMPASGTDDAPIVTRA